MLAMPLVVKNGIDADAFAPVIRDEVCEVIGVKVSAAPALLKPVKLVAAEVTEVGTESTAATIEGTLAVDLVHPAESVSCKGACTTGLNRFGSTMSGNLGANSGTTFDDTAGCGLSGSALKLGISIH